MAQLAADRGGLLRHSLERWQREARAIVLDGGMRHPDFGWAFQYHYLPHYARRKDGTTIPSASWHKQLWHDLCSLLWDPRSAAGLAPRGYAKTTIAQEFVLACLAKREREFMWLVQDTSEQARQSMQGIMAEVEGNERIRRDFPHLRLGIDPSGRPIADRDVDVVFASGQRLQAFGSGTKLRGRRQQQYRPDAAIIDDLENDLHVSTPYQRDKLDMWLSSALMGALGEDAFAVMLGTLLHHDSVLARKLDTWEAWRYEAVTDHHDFSTSTWPEFWTAERLEKVRREMGVRAFSREFLHEPVDEDAAMFRRDAYQYRNSRERLLNSQGQVAAQVRIPIDPAFSDKKMADYSAVSVVAQINAGEWDVLDVWRGRVSGEKLIERAEAVWKQWAAWQPVFIVETIGAQVWLADDLERRGFPVRRVRPVLDKVARAGPLSVKYENHQVYHDEALRDSDYEMELAMFPLGDHDDMVDTVVYGVDDLSAGPVAAALPQGEMQMPWRGR